jgi:hypothetical protein
MIDDAASAEDGEKYEDDPEEAAAPGLAVTSLASATGAAAGFAAGGPFGAAVGAAAIPYLAVVFQKTADKIWNDRSRRAEKMLETAAETAGLSTEDFAERAGETEQTRFLTDKAIQAAADTIWPEGVRAIGRAYAAGLLAKDKPQLDIRLRALGIMQDLDEAHVRLLDLLVRYEPDVQRYEPEDGIGPDRVEIRAVPVHGRSHYYSGAEIANRKWTWRQIHRIMPEIEPVLATLLGELRESGLIAANDTAPDTTAAALRQLHGQLENAEKRKPRLATPSWSPTELGEKILAFYAEAGAEDIQDQG